MHHHSESENAQPSKIIIAMRGSGDACSSLPLMAIMIYEGCKMSFEKPICMWLLLILEMHNSSASVKVETWNRLDSLEINLEVALASHHPS